MQGFQEAQDRRDGAALISPVREAARIGQSFWYDTLSRRLLLSGELRRLVVEVGIRGVTSNPSIFETVMAKMTDYESSLRALLQRDVRAPKTIYEEMALEDVRAAADLLFPFYLESEGADGYVSFEVSPHLAHDTEATVAEARRLFAAAGRPNVMIKVPGTREGMPAIKRLIGEGISVKCDAALRPRGVSGMRQGAPARAGASRCPRRGRAPSRQGRELLSEPHRCGGGRGG
jgi:transaldolase / glucose-6-phosphate isomerase